MRDVYKKYSAYIITTILMIISGFIQAYSIEVFIRPSNLITGGFTGIALLFNKILETTSFQIPLAILLIILNFPVALMCAKEISKKFVFYSLVQIFACSFFLERLHFGPLFNSIVLNITIGAVVYGLELVLALKAGGSSGGTDFIALYISNRINKSIWLYVFVLNMLIIFIFGYMFGWDNAGYTLVFQFVTTKVIDTFYNRYHRITLNIVTKKEKEVIKAYIENYRHGMTKFRANGAYSNEEVSFCYTVVSVYEVNDVVETILKADPSAIINTYKTEHFYGKFYIPPI